MLSAFKVLAKLKGLRGTRLDPFGYTKLLSEYESLVQDLIAGLDAHNLAVGVELASLPGQIRGYGHIKERHVKHAKRRQAELLESFRNRSKPVAPGGQGVRHSVVIMAG